MDHKEWHATLRNKYAGRGRHRKGRGNPINSSLPRHGAKIRNKGTKKKGKTTKTKPRAGCKLAKKDIEQEELYNAWTY